MTALAERPAVDATEPTDFPSLLRFYRTRAGLSSRSLSLHAAGPTSNYVARLELGTRTPSRQYVERLIAMIPMSPLEADRLLVAAGYAPKRLMAIGWGREFDQLTNWKWREWCGKE